MTKTDKRKISIKHWGSNNPCNQYWHLCTFRNKYENAYLEFFQKTKALICQENKINRNPSCLCPSAHLECILKLLFSYSISQLTIKFMFSISEYTRNSKILFYTSKLPNFWLILEFIFRVTLNIRTFYILYIHFILEPTHTLQSKEALKIIITWLVNL